MSRLATQFPALAAYYEGLPDALQRRLVSQLVAEVASMHGLDTEGLSQDEVERLDASAWDLQEAGDEAAYRNAFGRARAASAVVTLAGGAVDDALYETLHGMPDQSEAESEAVLRRLADDG